MADLDIEGRLQQGSRAQKANHAKSRKSFSLILPRHTTSRPMRQALGLRSNIFCIGTGNLVDKETPNSVQLKTKPITR